jgi:hypothetical protein
LNEETQSVLEIFDPQHRAEIQLSKNDYIISVVARNSAGSSPPSKIASMEIPNGKCLGGMGDVGWDGNPVVSAFLMGGVSCPSCAICMLCIEFACYTYIYMLCK